MKKLLIAAATLIFISSYSKKDSTPEKVYTKVSVAKLTILNYPATKTSGANWDASLQGTYPDVYFKLTQSGTTNSLYSLSTSSRAENLRTVDLPYSWSNSSGALELTNIWELLLSISQTTQMVRQNIHQL